MSVQVATVAQLYLYPVKAMRGVPVAEAALGINGLYGDRRYSFVREDVMGKTGFPWTTARTKPRLLLYVPRFVSAVLPDYLPDSRTFGRTPVRVQTPTGSDYALEDPPLCVELSREYGEPLVLLQSHRGLYDSQQLSLFNLATVAQLEAETHLSIDHRQFRANVYLAPLEKTPFAEDSWVGCLLKIGSEALVGVTEKNERCAVVNLLPDSVKSQPQVLRTIVTKHNQEAGIYATVIRGGRIRVGDPVHLV